MKRPSDSERVSEILDGCRLDAYLSNEVEGNHVSGLGGDRVGSELELVVRRDSDHHSGGGSCHGLGKPGSEDGGEEHVDGVVVELDYRSEWMVVADWKLQEMTSE